MTGVQTCALPIQDPFPKPCYLFALVAGNLEVVEDSYTTGSGKNVALRIFTQPESIDKVGAPARGRWRGVRCIPACAWHHGQSA